MLGSMAGTRTAHVSALTSLPDGFFCGCRLVFEGRGITAPFQLFRATAKSLANMGQGLPVRIQVLHASLEAK